MLPKINKVDLSLRTELLKEIDEIARNDENIEKALDLIDKEILVNHLGLDIELCNQFRNIWKKLQHRRLARS